MLQIKRNDANTYYSNLINNFLIATQMIDTGIDPMPENMVEGLDVVSPDDAMSLIKRKYLWFGPRLGRKKRTLPVQDDESQFDRNSNDESVIEFIKESPWALVPLKGNLLVFGKILYI